MTDGFWIDKNFKRCLNIFMIAKTKDKYRIPFEIILSEKIDELHMSHRASFAVPVSLVNLLACTLRWVRGQLFALQFGHRASFVKGS